MKRLLGVLILARLSTVVLAGEAVKEINGKAGFFAGNMDGETGNNMEGSFSVPLGTKFGAQVDGFYSNVSDRDFYGLGAHLFWRDSEIGLLGVSAAGIRENDVLDSWSGGVEGEYYLHDFTLSMQGGVVNMDYSIGPLPFIETDETGYYAVAQADYYPLDDLQLSISYSHALDNGMARAQLEYQTPLAGMSVFVDLAEGDHGYDHAMLGVRYYFGKQKSLKLRHREDDPPNALHGLMYTIGTYGEEFNKRGEQYISNLIKELESGPPLSGPPLPGGSYGSTLTVSSTDLFSSGSGTSGSYGSVTTVQLIEISEPVSLFSGSITIDSATFIGGN